MNDFCNCDPSFLEDEISQEEMEELGADAERYEGLCKCNGEYCVC